MSSRGIRSSEWIEATTTVDHRVLGMTWSPLGILRSPSTLIVRGRLVHEEGV